MKTPVIVMTIVRQPTPSLEQNTAETLDSISTATMTAVKIVLDAKEN